MAKDISILPGDYFDKDISHQVESGRLLLASEVVRAALRLFEQEEKHKVELIKELRKAKSPVSLKKQMIKSSSAAFIRNI